MRQRYAKVNFLHQKYDVLVTINKRIEECMILVKQDAINGDNIEELINYLIDVQNWFNKNINQVYVKVFKNFSDLKTVFDPKYYKQEYLKTLNFKKKEICDIFYNTIIKWFLNDIMEMSKKFINRNELNFEKNLQYK